jgi:hypothetical protein
VEETLLPLGDFHWRALHGDLDIVEELFRLIGAREPVKTACLKIVVAAVTVAIAIRRTGDLS